MTHLREQPTIGPDPDQPHVLRSFGARDNEPFDEIEHDLKAKALALEDATGRRLLLITVELAGTYPAQHTMLAEVCQDRWDVAPSGVVLMPTDTHYAPQFHYRPEDLSEDATDAEQLVAQYREMVDETIIAVGDAAVAELEPAELRFYRSTCGMAMSRRRPAEDLMHFDPNPDPPVDHDVPVLTATTGSGSLNAILFGYACHPTVGTATYNGVSGDWPGYTMRYLEEEHPGATVMFLIGCGGDQKAYPQGTREWVRRHARTARNAVERALVTDQVGGRTEPYRVSGPLRHVSGETVLDLHHQLETEDGHPDGVDVAQRQYPITAIGFGRDLTMLVLSGEVVPAIANRLKDELVLPVWTAAYSHKYVGYIVTDRMLAEGGSEARSSGMSGYRYAPGTADRVVESAAALAQRVGCRRTSD